MSTVKPFFSTKFKKELTEDGTITYCFQSCYRQDDVTHNEIPPLAVDGLELYSTSSDSDTSRTINSIFTELPEETHNPTVYKKVYEAWIRDCSGAFLKSPTLEQCLANSQSLWDSNAPVATVNTLEQDSDWILQWVPTKILVAMSRFQIYWAPCYKIPCARIPELIDQASLEQPQSNPLIELQSPEKTYTITRRTGLPVQGDYLQEISDVAMPYSELPPLRLDPNFEQQKERYRRRVREARIRAKLARYRAERLAQRYEDRYGIYPEEDEEECQTEAEQTEDE
jgi:hypothetical protein